MTDFVTGDRVRVDYASGSRFGTVASDGTHASTHETWRRYVEVQLDGEQHARKPYTDVVEKLAAAVVAPTAADEYETVDFADELLVGDRVTFTVTVHIEGRRDRLQVGCKSFTLDSLRAVTDKAGAVIDPEFNEELLLVGGSMEVTIEDAVVNDQGVLSFVGGAVTINADELGEYGRDIVVKRKAPEPAKYKPFQLWKATRRDDGQVHVFQVLRSGNLLAISRTESATFNGRSLYGWSPDQLDALWDTELIFDPAV